MLKTILIISKKTEDEKLIEIYNLLKLKKFKKMNFLDFCDWYEDVYEENWKYVQYKKYYGFRLTFYKESFCFKKESNKFPEYPWNANFKKEILNKDKDFLYFSHLNKN